MSYSRQYYDIIDNRIILFVAVYVYHHNYL